jgi:hypothetical protein
MFLFFLARAQQVSCGKITVLTSTKKKVRRVLARKSLPPRTTGYLFNFPATLFLVQSYGLYVVEARGAILSVPGLRATYRNILWSTTKVNEAYARPPHVG